MKKTLFIKAHKGLIIMSLFIHQGFSPKVPLCLTN